MTSLQVKAAGPDKLKPFLLRELREEITPIIQINFSKHVSKHPILTVVTKAVIRIRKLQDHLGLTSRLTKQRLVIMEIAITSFLV